MEIPEDFSSNEYWRSAAELINHWILYQETRLLFQCVLSLGYSSKVQEIFRERYGGDLKRLNSAKVHFSKKVDTEIEYFKKVCKAYKVEPIDRDWLYNNLQNEETCRALRSKCRRRIFKGCPAKSLKEIIYH
ncbi:hypothetical protein IKG41_02335 [Candidatus Saccharibacteria bacterium]|nr:hypothetical protein [Candidatus Saccharibacteria bacterium]